MSQKWELEDTYMTRKNAKLYDKMTLGITFENTLLQRIGGAEVAQLV
jgi:hypothetical protein